MLCISQMSNLLVSVRHHLRVWCALNTGLVSTLIVVSLILGILLGLLGLFYFRSRHG